MKIAFTSVQDKVFIIRVNKNSQGTCFLLEHKSKKYLVTAKHLFSNLQVNNLVEIGEYNSIGEIVFCPINATFSCSNLADLIYFDVTLDIKFSLLKGLVPLYKYHPNDYDETAFFGFPSGMTFTNYNKTKYPTPLIKTAHFMALVEENGIKHILIDAISTLGFSGSPVLVMKDDSLRVIGIAVSNRFTPTKSVEQLGTDLLNGIYTKDPCHIVNVIHIELVEKIADNIALQDFNKIA